MGDFCQGPSAPSYPLCEGLLRDGSPCTHHAGVPPRTPGDDLCGTVVPAPTCRRSARAWLCHARHPGLLSRVEKVGKDTPGTSWFGVRRTPDLRHKGADPLGFPGLCPSGIGCGNLNPQASSGSSLPRHGLKIQSIPSMKPEEKTRPICPPTRSGKSVYFCG